MMAHLTRRRRSSDAAATRRKRDAYALFGLEYAPKGFACDTKRGRGWCRKPALVAYAENPELPDDHTYKCEDDAPGFPDVFYVYDVYFDWNPRHERTGERRVVTGVIARCEPEALVLYQAFVDRSKLVDAPTRTRIDGEDWNESVHFVRADATEEQFLDFVRAAIDGDAQCRAYFADVLDRGGE